MLGGHIGRLRWRRSPVVKRVWRSRCSEGRIWVAECVDERDARAPVVCPTCGGALSWWLAWL